MHATPVALLRFSMDARMDYPLILTEIVTNEISFGKNLPTKS
jgi:hypothetical protein